ncbi:hypothetical protein R1sor_011396 [Riccia sorocarpa]|uniref:Uncharacterized protein n=1 Tax=Riccia sorocarpa TaxID=122646 RepID=A0ABD3I0Q3_9MARC
MSISYPYTTGCQLSFTASPKLRKSLKLEMDFAGPVHGFSRRGDGTKCRNLHAVHVEHEKLAAAGSMGKTSCKTQEVNGSKGGTCELEEQHTCILSFEDLHIIYSHKELEPIIVENHWKPVTLCRFTGWREYHSYKPKSSPTEGDALPLKVRLPEPIQDAQKQDILKLVRNVNEMANKNILCAWVHKDPKIAPSF